MTINDILSGGVYMVLALVLVWAAVAAVLVLLYCIAPGELTAEAIKTAEIFYGLNCAHRGLHSQDQQIPENSIAAFEAARNEGYGVELDVQLSKDGHVVVFHDNDLNRACGVDAAVSSMDLGDLIKLPLFGTNECIPLLSDVLAVLGDAPVIVELKSPGADHNELCRKTLDILRADGRFWCVESFDPRVVGWFIKNAPDVLRGQLSCRPWEYNNTSKLMAFLLGNLMLNFLSRPHFVAYSTAKRSFAVNLCRAIRPVNVIWTVSTGDDIHLCEEENDTVIFEYYKPAPRFKTRPG